MQYRTITIRIVFVCLHLLVKETTVSMMSTIPWPYRSGGAPKTNSPQCILAPFDGKNKFSNITDRGEKQEDRLMLTNPRDAFRGQSRSPNTVLFDILVTVSY